MNNNGRPVRQPAMRKHRPHPHTQQTKPQTTNETNTNQQNCVVFQNDKRFRKKVKPICDPRSLRAQPTALPPVKVLSLSQGNGRVCDFLMRGWPMATSSGAAGLLAGA